MQLTLALLNLGLKTASAAGWIKTRTDAALHDLDAKVSSLITQPLHEGLARLEQAATTISPDLQRTLLNEARAKFTDVASRPAAPLAVRALAEVALASCWWNLDHADLARAALLRAVELQSSVIDELRAAWTKHSPHPSAWSAAAGAPPASRAAGGMAAGAAALAAGAALPLLGPVAVTTFGAKKLRDRRADSRRRAVEIELARCDGDTQLLLEMAARTGADGMSRAAAELRAKLPALPTA